MSNILHAYANDTNMAEVASKATETSEHDKAQMATDEPLIGIVKVMTTVQAKNRDTVHADDHTRVTKAMSSKARSLHQFDSSNSSFLDLEELVHKLRLIKQTHQLELACYRTSASIVSFVPHMLLHPNPEDVSDIETVVSTPSSPNSPDEAHNELQERRRE